MIFLFIFCHLWSCEGFFVLVSQSIRQARGNDFQCLHCAKHGLAPDCALETPRFQNTQLAASAIASTFPMKHSKSSCPSRAARAGPPGARPRVEGASHRYLQPSCRRSRVCLHVLNRSAPCFHGAACTLTTAGPRLLLRPVRTLSRLRPHYVERAPIGSPAPSGTPRLLLDPRPQPQPLVALT